MTLLPLLFIGAISSSPFSPNVTVEIQDYDGTITQFVYDPVRVPGLRDKPHRAVFDYDDSADPAGSAAAGDDDCATTSTASTWIPITIADWDTVPVLHINVQWEDAGRYSWPNSTTSWTVETLNQMKALYQILFAVALRDVNVNVQIDHVLIMKGGYDNAATASGDTIAWWSANHPGNDVMRLGLISAPLASIGGTCIAYTRLGRAVWYETLDPLDPANRYYTQIAAQELFHMIFGLQHTQCYADLNGKPLEACPDKGVCYNGPLICPPWDEISVMGYCYACYNPGSNYEWAYLRLGPMLGLESQIARHHVLNYQCLSEVAATFPRTQVPYIIDTDGDGYPDALDNCPLVNNPEQTDSNLNVKYLLNRTAGKGDACDSGCQVSECTRLRIADALQLLALLGFALWLRAMGGRR